MAWSPNQREWFLAVRLVSSSFQSGQAAPAGSYRAGIAALERGAVDESIPLLQSAAELAKTNAQYWKALGVAYATRQEHSLAAQAFGNACKLDPQLSDACYYHGRALYFADQYEAALAPLQTALRYDAQKDRADTALGQAHEALGRPREAERHFKAALERKGAWASQARLAYGKFLGREGRIDEALTQLRAAISPETAEALTELARVLMQDGQAGEAALRLERALQLDPKLTASRLLLAKAYRRLGRNADAVRQEQLAQGSLSSK